MKPYTYISKVVLISTIVAAASPVIGTGINTPIVDEAAPPYIHQQPQNVLDVLLQQLAATEKDQAAKRRQDKKHNNWGIKSPVKPYKGKPQSLKKGAR